MSHESNLICAERGRFGIWVGNVGGYFGMMDGIGASELSEE